MKFVALVRYLQIHLFSERHGAHVSQSGVAAMLAYGKSRAHLIAPVLLHDHRSSYLRRLACGLPVDAASGGALSTACPGTGA